MEESFSFAPEDAKMMGYDPEVVKFLKNENPKLLEFMWGVWSDHYDSILKNTITNTELIDSIEQQIILFRRFGNVAESSILLLKFRLAKTKKESE